MLTFHYRPVYIALYSPPTWADGTDAEIAEAIAKADAGEIELSNYWAVGDERTAHLSAMTAGDGLYNAQPEQYVVLVLMDTGTASGYEDVNNKSVNFVWGQKDCLSQTGRMNLSSTTSNSWNGCAMRTNLNNKYYNALPTDFKSCLKQFKTITAQTYNGSTNQISNDYIALFAEKEVFGSCINSNSTEANALTQIEYYKTTANRFKKISGNNDDWWERSSVNNYSGSFCFVDSYGYATINAASSSKGVAPFGCI